MLQNQAILVGDCSAAGNIQKAIWSANETARIILAKLAKDETDQTDQIDEIDQTNQTDQTDETMEALCKHHRVFTR
jgi:hypothetical protein